MIKRKGLKIGLLALAASVVTGAALYLLWQIGFFLPRWIEWKSGPESDCSGLYELEIKQREVRLLRDGVEIWRPEKGIKTQQALFGDIDSDGDEELLLLCWKVGRYGEEKPFWVEQDERKWSQHIFVYEYEGETVRPKWMSSYLGQDVTDIAMGKEGPASKRLFLTDRQGKISCWFWDSWGFAKEERDVLFSVFGDNLVHEPIYRYGLNHGGSFDFLFENVADAVSQSDIAVINQETPLVEDAKKYSDYPRFGTPVPVGEAIAAVGFDVVTCATNHALDQGPDGVDTTKSFFTSRQIVCLGIQSRDETEDRAFEIMEKNGIRFALFNYTYGTNGIRLPEENPYMVHLLEDEEKIQKDLLTAREKADVVIVFVHWGTENSGQTDDFQRKWAQIFLESQVDVVVGTHPHVAQPYELLEGKEGHRMLIYYSIGNFVSAQPEKTAEKGGMASFRISLTPFGYEVTEYGFKRLVIQWKEDGKYVAEWREDEKAEGRNFFPD